MMNTLGFDGLSPLKSSGCCCSCSCWARRSTCAEPAEARLLSSSKHGCWACRSTCAELVEALVLSLSKRLCWACRSNEVFPKEKLVQQWSIQVFVKAKYQHLAMCALLAFIYYEELLTTKNASRWIIALWKYAYIPQRAEKRQAYLWLYTHNNLQSSDYCINKLSLRMHAIFMLTFHERIFHPCQWKRMHKS